MNRRIVITCLGACLIHFLVQTLAAEETFKLKLDLETWAGLESANVLVLANGNEVTTKSFDPENKSAEFDITAYLKDGANTISIKLNSLVGSEDFIKMIKDRSKNNKGTLIISCNILRNGVSMKEHKVGTIWDESSNTAIAVDKDMAITIKRQNE